MRTLAVARRELRSAFDSPVAYVLLGLVPAVAAAFFFLVGGFFAEGTASLRGFFALMPWLLIFVAPAVTMRLWSEERRSGTEELLLTYPFRVRELVLGKFLAAWTLLALALAATAGVPLTVAWLGDLDWGPVVGGYVGTLLLGAASIAAGLLLSACTRNQVVAWLCSVVLLVVLNLLAVAATASAVPPALGRVLLFADFGARFESIARGVLDLRDLLFYAGVTALFLAWNGLAVERRRWL